MGWAKDFLAAFKMGYDLVGSSSDAEYKKLRNQVLKDKIAKDKDPVRRKLENAVLARRAAGPQARPLDPVTAAHRKEVTRAIKIQNDAAGTPAAAPPSAIDKVRPLPTDLGGSKRMVNQQDVEDDAEADAADEATQALPLEPELDDDITPESIEPEPAPAAPEQEYSRGGAVAHFEDGGSVEDDNDEDDVAGGVPDDDEDDYDADEAPGLAARSMGGGAIPSSPDAPAAAAPAAKGQELANPELTFSFYAAHKAGLDGLRYAAKATGVNQDDKEAIPTDVSDARRTASHRAYLARPGAASQHDMDAIRNKIDPNNRLSESMRNMAALAHVNGYELSRGNPEGAAKASAAIMMFYGQRADTYKALVKAAAEGGKVDDVIKYALKFHANVPDGMELGLVKKPDGNIAYSFTDEKTGKVVERAIVAPDKLIEFASSGMMNMENLMAQASGRRAAGGGGAKAEKPAKSTVRKPAERDTEAFDTEIARTGKDGKPLYTIPEQISGDIKHVASQLHSENDIPVATALQIAGGIGSNAEGFTIDMEKGAIVTPEGRRVRLSQDGIDNVIAMRAVAKRGKAASDAKAVVDQKKTAELDAARQRTEAHEAQLPERADAAALQRVKEENAARRERQAVPIE